MTALIPPPIPGTRRLGASRLRDAPFDPCFDLTADGVVLATLFYDDKPDCAHTTVDLENEAGEIEAVPGAAAGLDEDEVGWCLQFTDHPRLVEIIARVPAQWEPLVRAMACVRVADRITELGPWEPFPPNGFRLWGETPTGPPDGVLE